MSMDTIEDWVRDPGSNLRAWRRRNNITLVQLAAGCNVSVSYLSDIERHRTNPSLKTLQKLLYFRDNPKLLNPTYY